MHVMLSDIILEKGLGAPHMLTSKIEKTTLVEQVQQEILRTIRKSDLKVGDSLPSELELTGSLGVSRTVVREALSRLRMLGLLESRRKRGMVLCEPPVFAGSSQILDAAFLSKKTQRHLAELRMVIEVGMAELLFSRKTDADVEELEAIVKKMDEVKIERRRIKLDIDFHAKLYTMTGNSLLFEFQSLLLPFFTHEAEEQRRSGAVRTGDASHHDILEALKNGTPETFRAIMRQHVEWYVDLSKRSE